MATTGGREVTYPVWTNQILASLNNELRSNILSAKVLYFRPLIELNVHTYKAFLAPHKIHGSINVAAYD
jgi:hypothetical protein